MLSIEKQTGYSTGDVVQRVYHKFDSLKKNNENLNVSVLIIVHQHTNAQG